MGSSMGWPFVCNGSPFSCEVFIVGINPANDVPIWPCWSDEIGLDRFAWLREYINRHQKYTPTRRMIERLVEATAPARVLETNIYHHCSPRLADLSNDKKQTDVFDYLVESIRPRILFVHGGPTIKHIQRRLSIKLVKNEFVQAKYHGTEVDILARDHLIYQTTYKAVDDLGNRLRDRVKQKK
jgi:hypothetical protein